MPEYESDPSRFSLDVHCPRCGHLIHALPETDAVYHISPYMDSQAYLVVRCPRHLCDVFFVIYDRLNRRVESVYPFPDSSVGDFHSAIPESIRKNFAEARRCWFADAHKGVVVMCRRAMQQIAGDKGAEGSRLIDQIDDLRTKGLITKSLHDAAHEIRHFGNFGAHPRDDGLDAITPDDANTILNLTNQFLVDLYIRPHETAKLTTRRQGT
jgi:hypothetical protein